MPYTSFSEFRVHNVRVPRSRLSTRQHALMHVDDAAELHIADGDLVRVNSPHGAIELPVTATKDIVAGVIAVPHGWGHKGSGDWRTPQAGRT